MHGPSIVNTDNARVSNASFAGDNICFADKCSSSRATNIQRCFKIWLLHVHRSNDAWSTGGTKMMRVLASEPDKLPGCSTWLPMGAKCNKAIYCGLWVQCSSVGCGLFEKSSGIGSRKACLPPINGWQVQDRCLTAYTLLYFTLPGCSKPRRCLPLRLPSRSGTGQVCAPTKLEKLSCPASSSMEGSHRMCGRVRRPVWKISETAPLNEWMREHLQKPSHTENF